MASYIDTDAGTLLRKLSVRKTSDPYTKHSIPFVKPMESRKSVPSTRQSLEVSPPNRSVTDTDEQGGVGRNVGSDPAPPYRNFTIIDEYKRSSRNLGPESPLPNKNFVIKDEHKRNSRNLGSEPSSPYRSPSVGPERASHKELVQPVMGEPRPPLPPRSVPPPIPPRASKPSIDLAR